MAYYPRIRELRKDVNLSPRAIAESIGIHRTTYIRYERGIYDLPLNVLYDLATYYNLSSDYILGLINTPTPLKSNIPSTY